MQKMSLTYFSDEWLYISPNNIFLFSNNYALTRDRNVSIVTVRSCANGNTAEIAKPTD